MTSVTRRGGIILVLTSVLVVGLGAVAWACLPDSVSGSAAEASDDAGAAASGGSSTSEGSSASAGSSTGSSTAGQAGGGHSLAFSVGLIAAGLLGWPPEAARSRFTATDPP